MKKDLAAMFEHFSRINKRSIMKFVGLGVLVIAIIFKVFVPPAGVSDIEGKARIIDGDSLYVGGREVRLQGIDAPEGRQTCRRDGREWACGNAARNELAKMIAGREVACHGLDIDRHDRLLAVCRANGRELNREMVARGFAVSYGNYQTEEAEALRARLGVWAGEFDRPRDWRRQRNIGQ